jgi:hypothetical protein
MPWGFLVRGTSLIADDVPKGVGLSILISRLRVENVEIQFPQSM